MAHVESPPAFFATDNDDELEVSHSAHIESEPAAPSSSPASEDPLFLPDDDSDTNVSPLTRFKAFQDDPMLERYESEVPETILMSKRKEGDTGAERPRKRAKLSPVSTVSNFKSAYFGTIIVANAWSTVKGKASNYVKSGDEILVEWDGNMDESKVASTSKKGSKPVKGKSKQLSIAAMLKAQPVKRVPRKKQNDIVRLTNKRGFGTFYSSLISPKLTDS